MNMFICFVRDLLCAPWPLVENLYPRYLYVSSVAITKLTLAVVACVAVNVRPQKSLLYVTFSLPSPPKIRIKDLPVVDVCGSIWTVGPHSIAYLIVFLSPP